MNWRLKLAVGFVAVLGLASTASAAPLTGHVNITGNVAVSITDLDFRPPTNNGIPCAIPGEGCGLFTIPGGSGSTTGSFIGSESGGLCPPTGCQGGQILDLTLAATAGYQHVNIMPVPSNVPNFLSNFSAPGFGTFHFDLTEVEAPAGPPCVGGETAGTVCSVTAFTVTVLPGGNNVGIAMNVAGYFQVGADVTTKNFFTGRFTTQVGHSTQEIEDILVKGLQDNACAPGDTGKICASYSANFDSVAAVPEPATMLTFGAGTALMAAYRRRRAAKKA